ncbi:uncharacterized protein LOC125032704 [Penaeus chinensis]|uniref:uncharacterized protein LOC125032704 n=1 Tax=Penaeus chinensis TaxID=139456 RepID=UPI001FB5BEB5|nr:uncharacterized protein LOC125032704 [Penaeus chinensis]
MEWSYLQHSNGDDYSQDLSLYGSGQGTQKGVFGDEISEHSNMIGGTHDEDIFLFENYEDTQNGMLTEHSGGDHGLEWNTMSTVSNQDSMNISYNDSQCHYLISTTAGGAYVTVNNDQQMTQDSATSSVNDRIVNSVPTTSKTKERMYARKLGNCPDENRRIRNASRAHMNRVKKEKELKQMEADTAQVRRQIALLKQMKERQEATNEWLEYELHLRSANQ